jgi:hypothetical protein
MDVVSMESASATMDIRVKIVPCLCVTVMAKENAFTTKNVFVMMASLEIIVKKLLAKITVTTMEFALKASAYVSQDGEGLLAI